MTFYRRNLPHWQPAGAEYFVTFGLAGSLPKNAVKKLMQERIMLKNKLNQQNISQQDEYRNLIHKKIFHKYEELLHGGKSGPT